MSRSDTDESKGQVNSLRKLDGALEGAGFDAAIDASTGFKAGTIPLPALT